MVELMELQIILNEEKDEGKMNKEDKKRKMEE